MLKLINDLLFPPRCPACDKLSIDGEFCVDCADELGKLKVQGPVCKFCGLKYEFCECDKYNYLFSGICSSFINKDLAKNSVYAIKYGNRAYAAKTFGEILGADFESKFSEVDIDLVTAVPMSKSSKRKRDYNHAGLLAKSVADYLDKPFNNKVLVKIKNNKLQHELSAEERRKNVKGVYKAKGDLEGKTVLLVDDIKTTGATLNECAKQLRLSGADRVFCATVLISSKYACNED
jgi:ComF family protein